MAHCQQCGAEVDEAAQFCPACGLRMARPAGPGAVAPLAERTPWRGRRVVLIFLGVIAVAALAFVLGVVYFIRHTTIVTSNKNGGRMESPFGVVTANNDPGKLAHSLGIEVYPGAVGEKSEQAELSTNNMVSMLFRTPDPPQRVISFYHVRYPDATTKTQGKGYALVQMNLLDTMTIQASREGAQTRIEIDDIRR